MAAPWPIASGSESGHGERSHCLGPGRANLGYHLNRAMDSGLTQREASEVLTHLAFYAGWPNVFSAMPVVKEVFEKRAK